MQKTTNYQLNKIELTDSPADITVINGNWDTIDSTLKEHSDDIDSLEKNKFDKTGGTLSGKVTISTGGIDVNGDSTFNNKLTIKGITTHENPIRSTKAEFLQTQAPVVRGTAPASTVFSYWSVFDKNGWGVAQNRLAHIDYSVDSTGSATLAFYANKYVAGDSETPAGMYIRWNGENAIIAMTHQPPDNSNDYSIASTQWVRKKITELSSKVLLVRY